MRRLGPALVLLLGASARVLYLLDSRVDPTFRAPIIDAHTYQRMATDLAGGAWPAEPFFQPPGYPVALAGLYALFGADPAIARAAGLVLGLATLALTMFLGRRLGPPGTGLLAGTIVALSAPMIFFEQQILPAGPGALLTTATLSLAAWGAASGRRVAWALAGAVAGLATLNVANLLVAAPLALGLAGVLAARRRFRGAASAGLFALAMLIVLAPVSIRNSVLAGRPLLVSTNGGINLYLANNPEAERTEAMRPGYAWAELFRSAARGGARTTAETDALYLRRAVAWMAEEPGRAAAGGLRRGRQLLSGREPPRNQDLYTHAGHSPLLSFLAAPFGVRALPFAALLALAAAGLANAWRRPDRRIVAALVLLYAATMLLFPVASRYRVPLIPALAVFAAIGARVMIVRGHADGRRRVRTGLIAAAVFLVAMLPVTGPADSVPFRAEMFTMLGRQALGAGDVEGAVAHLQRATEEDANFVLAWQLLGVARREAGDLPGAEEALRTAVDTGGGAEAHLLLGETLLARGQADAAEDEFARAVEASPEIPRASAALAFFATVRGDAPAAIAHLRRAVEADPLDPEPALDLAWRLATTPDDALRDGEEALRVAEAALDRLRGDEPVLVRDPGALEVHAAALAETGEPERALRVAQRALAGWERRGRSADEERVLEAARGYERGTAYRSNLTERPGGPEIAVPGAEAAGDDPQEKRPPGGPSRLSAEPNGG